MTLAALTRGAGSDTMRAMPDAGAKLPLSVAIVCKDSEGTIARMLESVAGLAEEIVAVDSGSTDGTIGLLERHGARVIRSAWLGYVKTKQLALESCTREWVLCLDSDESVEPELGEAIRAAILRGNAGTDGFEMNRKVYYRDRPLNHVWQPEWRVRLVRRGAARWEGLDPHDELRLSRPSATARLSGTLRHDSISTFAEFFAKQVGHGALMARSLHAAGKRGSLARLVASPAGAFLKQMVIKSAWRDGYAGWLGAAATAAAALVKHAVLVELTRTARNRAANTLRRRDQAQQ